ncbi:YoaK family protein [Mycolicibacter minnesotensis]
MLDKRYGSEARLSWILAGLAGVLAATAFTHSEGYFVTFMTGNAGRGALGVFTDDQWMSISAAALLVSFILGVVVASLCHRHVWRSRPHGALRLTGASLLTATIVDWIEGGPALPVPLLPILLVAFGVGALNTTFVSNGEVSIPLSYVTGTVVKLGQGIERHISGGSFHDWFFNFMLLSGYISGAVVGGFISLFAGGTWMLAIGTGICVLASWYSHRYVDGRGFWR